VIFVDANVPMYLVGGEHPHKIDVQRILERLASEQRHLVTSSEVLQEIMHRYISAGRRDWIEHAFNAMRAIVDEVLQVEEADILIAKNLVHSHPKLSTRDAVHAAVMRRREITEILSFDRGFDAVAGITRLPAAERGV
jgi:predicted nucleic acid-binding protein